ncbi:hypothetical protein [Mycobacterium sp. 3519A]|uniref:hypothetical protein n=1 Tax=Mycobacterium sp. 3519A TaxID=2057184 RepID=UPI000C7D6CFC|nr:hypothetical protein [Mycobacterium sp. 3519A]
MGRNIRIAGIAVFAAALALSGCGDKSEKSEPTPTPTSEVAKESSPAPTPKASDEDQVRDVLTQESAAFGAWDFAKVGQLTCPKYREHASSVDSAIPPMDMYPADAAASMGAQAFAAQLGAQFPGASEQSLQAAADAVIRKDANAYRTTMLDVVKQSMSVQLDKVENIVIVGDTATADVTVTQRVGDTEPQSRTNSAMLVRENGVWLDCTPPEQQ